VKPLSVLVALALLFTSLAGAQPSRQSAVFDLVLTVQWLASMQRQAPLHISPQSQDQFLLILQDILNKSVLGATLAAEQNAALLALLEPAQQQWLEQQRKTVSRWVYLTNIRGKFQAGQAPTIYSVSIENYQPMSQALKSNESFNPFQLEPQRRLLNNLIQQISRQ
jgi:hypothetical protein